MSLSAAARCLKIAEVEGWLHQAPVEGLCKTLHLLRAGLLLLGREDAVEEELKIAWVVCSRSGAASEGEKEGLEMLHPVPFKVLRNS